MTDLKRIYQSDLPSRAIAVYLYLRGRANREGVCWPAIPTMARDLKMSESTVRRGVRDLERAGFLAVEVSVNSSNAVDKREQPPRKDGCSLFHVNAGLRRKKMERRLQEKQIPIGLLSKQVVLQVEEAAQLSGRSIRYKVEEPVSQVALVLKDV